MLNLILKSNKAGAKAKHPILYCEDPGTGRMCEGINNCPSVETDNLKGAGQISFLRPV